MKTDLKRYTVAETVKGFVYNELEGKGLFGLAGKLVRLGAGPDRRSHSCR